MLGVELAASTASTTATDAAAAVLSNAFGQTMHC
jgi:hypothetical protein